MNLLNKKDFSTNFDEFTLDHYSDKSANLKGVYEKNVTEIQNSTTISSILNQIFFYTEIKVLSKTSVLQILEELKNINFKHRKKAEQDHKKFHIYTILNSKLLE